MSTRYSRGTVRVGSVAADTSGGYFFDAGQYGVKTRVMPVSVGTTAETDTNWDLPTNALVRDAYALITTAASAASKLYVGLLATSSDGATAFINGISTSSTGLKVPEVTTNTSGFYSSNTRGNSLSAFAAGTTASLSGVYNTRVYPADSNTIRSVQWYTNSTGPSLLVGKIYIVYSELS